MSDDEKTPDDGDDDSVIDKDESDQNQTTPETDTDGDDIPDWWEDFHGLDPEDSTDALGDLDGDGITNLDEFKQGSSPSVDESVDADDKGSMIVYLIIGIILLLIIVILGILLARSGKEQTEPPEE